MTDKELTGLLVTGGVAGFAAALSNVLLAPIGFAVGVAVYGLAHERLSENKEVEEHGG